MKKLLFILLIGCTKTNVSTSVESSLKAAAPEHIIVVIEENHSYADVIGNADAAYINSLADSGTLFTNFHGVTHPSQPNYLALFSGSTQGVSDDKCLTKKLNAQNLFSKFLKAGKTCAWYSEDLPATGSITCNYNNYVRKHNPSSDFTNVPDECNKMFSDLPTDYSTLPNLVIISPNVQNDMHDGTIKQADDWLNNNLSSLVNWCKINNSLFIITWDEDDKTTDNNIPFIMYGENVKSTTISTNYNHYSLTKTICNQFGIGSGWTDNLKNATVIKGWYK